MRCVSVPRTGFWVARSGPPPKRTEHPCPGAPRDAQSFSGFFVGALKRRYASRPPRTRPDCNGREAVSLYRLEPTAKPHPKVRPDNQCCPPDLGGEVFQIGRASCRERV